MCFAPNSSMEPNFASESETGAHQSESAAIAALLQIHLPGLSALLTHTIRGPRTAVWEVGRPSGLNRLS